MIRGNHSFTIARMAADEEHVDGEGGGGVQAGFVPALPQTAALGASVAEALPPSASVAEALPPLASVAEVLPPPTSMAEALPLPASVAAAFPPSALVLSAPMLESIAPPVNFWRRSKLAPARSPLSLLLTASALVW
jgi:hypothetical protein